MKTLRPARVDARDKLYYFHNFFGSVQQFDDAYLVETGVFPDQDGDLRPTECTGYTVAEIGAAEDKQRYSPDYNYMKTLEVMNLPPTTDGADLRTAAKIACTYGLLPTGFVPNTIKNGSQAWAANQSNWPLEVDQEAFKNKKVNYLPIRNAYQDYFDAIRSALVAGKRENRIVGVGTQWSPDFENIGSDGILPEKPTRLYWGHAYAIVGWKTIGSTPYLIAKTWQGTKYGNEGYCYISRALCNTLLAPLGAYAFTLQDLGQAQTIPQQEINLLDILIALYQNLILSIQYGLSQLAPKPV